MSKPPGFGCMEADDLLELCDALWECPRYDEGGKCIVPGCYGRKTRGHAQKCPIRRVEELSRE